eukprot:gene6402-4602_t
MENAVPTVPLTAMSGDRRCKSGGSGKSGESWEWVAANRGECANFDGVLRDGAKVGGI